MRDRFYEISPTTMVALARCLGFQQLWWPWQDAWDFNNNGGAGILPAIDRILRRCLWARSTKGDRRRQPAARSAFFNDFN
jgi:hypothetical protein